MNPATTPPPFEIPDFVKEDISKALQFFMYVSERVGTMILTPADEHGNKIGLLIATNNEEDMERLEEVLNDFIRDKSDRDGAPHEIHTHVEKWDLDPEDEEEEVKAKDDYDPMVA